jgi:flagellar biosynthesis/type III secretory pathway protein FliH
MMIRRDVRHHHGWRPNFTEAFAEIFAETFAETFAEAFAETFAEAFAEVFAEFFAETFAETFAQGYTQPQKEGRTCTRRFRLAFMARDIDGPPVICSLIRA